VAVAESEFDRVGVESLVTLPPGFRDDVVRRRVEGARPSDCSRRNARRYRRWAFVSTASSVSTDGWLSAGADAASGPESPDDHQRTSLSFVWYRRGYS